MHLSIAVAFCSLCTTSVFGGPLIQKRASCPNIHVFGARETTAPAGYGSSRTFVNAILNAYPGSTSEAINYPAQGDSAYASSVQAGTKNIASQINNFNKQCPNSKLVVVGYSQGVSAARQFIATSKYFFRHKSETMHCVAEATQIKASRIPVLS